MSEARTHWHDRWDEGRLGFHQGAVNPALRAHLDRLPRDRVLVPLCGKTVDLAFLRDHGRPPVGVELVQRAVDDLFAEHDITPTVAGALHVGGGLTVFRGDFLGPELLAAVEPCAGVWDRAALIAIDPAQREAYRDRLLALMAPGATLLLTTLAYDPRQMSGPPFSVDVAEVERLFAPFGPLEHVSGSAASLPPRAGDLAAIEHVFVFEKRG